MRGHLARDWPTLGFAPRLRVSSMVYGGPATWHRPKGIGSSSGEQAEQPVPGGCGGYAQGNATPIIIDTSRGAWLACEATMPAPIIGGIAASMTLT